MRLALLIIRKFLSSRREKKYISRLSFFSYILVALGVAVPILVLSVTNGFQGMVERRVIHYDFHGQGFFPALLTRNELKPLKGFLTLGFYEDKCLLRSRQTSKVTQMRAFFAEDYENAAIFKTYQRIAGEVLPGPGGIVLAENLAYALRVGVGDEVRVIAVDHSLGYSSFTEKPLRIDGVVSLGYAAYDVTASFINKADADEIFLTQKEAFNKVGWMAEKKLSRETIQRTLTGAFQDYPEGVFSQTFENRVFKDFQEEKKSLTLAMFVIIFIAFLAIFITLNVVLADKVLDVGILKTLGVDHRSMTRIFLGQGAFIAFVGITAGFFLGSLMTVNLDFLIGLWEGLVNNLIFLTNLAGITDFPPFYRYQMMPDDVFYINSLPYALHFSDFAIQGVGAFVLSMVAAISPALKVVKTNPAQILRNE